MKNNEELKQTIIEKCDALKKELLSKIEPEFEVGKWYIQDNGVLNNYQLNNKSYGISLYKDWVIDNAWFKRERSEFKREATPSEVETALINEAKKRGFKDGLRLDRSNLIHNTCKTTIDRGSDNFEWDGKMLQLNGSSIFEHGNWATIVTEKTSEEWAMEYSNNLLNWLNKNNLKITKK